MLQSCTMGRNNDIYISYSSDQSNKLKLATLLLGALQSPTVKEECKMAGTIFVCQYSFPLCNCSSGEKYLPSREFCLYVSTEVCQQQWELARGEIPLPNCSDFISSGKKPSIIKTSCD